MKILASSVVSLLALAWSMSVAPVSAKHQVYIVKFLDVNTMLTVNCASKDQDLGTHKLTFGGNFHWIFDVDFWRTARFYCDMSWDNVTGRFNMFVAKRDAHRCSEDKCRWEVMKDGLYLYIWEHDEYELQFPCPHYRDV